MRLLLIGGSGVLGRAFCKQALDQGHEVIAVARTSDRAQILRTLGAATVPGNILEPESMQRACAGHHTVINLASAVPRKLKPKAEDWHLNDVIRVQGTVNVLQALTAGDVFYCQAGLAFLYGDVHGEWVDEASPIQPNRFTASARVAEDRFLNSSHPSLRGVSFRFSLFYHHEAWHTQRMIHEMRKRRFPVLGDGEFFWNLIHVDDAASAILTAIENRERISGREITNVVDDAPVLCREFLDHLAGLLEVHQPTRIPLFVARLAIGSETVGSVTASFRCRNNKLRSLGWKPAFPSFREGLPAVLQFL